VVRRLLNSCADVGHDALHLCRPVAAVRHRRSVLADPDHPLVPGQQPVLQVEGFGVLQSVVQLFQHLITVLGVQLPAPARGCDAPLFLGESGQRQDLRADVDGRGLLVHAGDVGRDGELLDQRPVA